jgi:hypothetical protein
MSFDLVGIDCTFGLLFVVYDDFKQFCVSVLWWVEDAVSYLP